MNFKPFFAVLLIIGLSSCKQETQQITRIEGKQITISDSLEMDPEIEAFIKPYRKHINKELDSVISYAMKTYSKKDGYLNTAIGNLFADAIFEQSNPIFNKRTGKNIDLTFANHGGIRAIISKGNITMRTAYQIMPFENSIVVAAVKGTQVNKLVDYLVERKKAHPISKLNIEIDAKDKLISATVKKEDIDTFIIYDIVTNVN